MNRRVLGAGLLLVATWLGVNAVWGLTSPQDTLVSALERRVAPLAAWVAGPALVLTLTAAVASRRHGRGLLAIAAMLLAYLLGVAISRYAKLWVDPTGGIPIRTFADGGRALFERSFLLIPALPMLVVVGFLCRRELPLRCGDWTAGNWRRSLLWALLGVGLPGFLLMQSTVGFGPLRSGTLWPALLPILALALLNASAEELLFRGLIQTPLVAGLGAGWGVLLQAAFFAIHHWGASPSPIAGAPMVLLLFFAALWMGRSVLDTRGLAWAIAFHTTLDLVFFAAHFVPGS